MTANYSFLISFHALTTIKSIESVLLHSGNAARATSLHGDVRKVISPISPARFPQQYPIFIDTKEAGPQSRTSLFPDPKAEQLNVAVSLFYWAARTGYHKKLLRPFLIFKAARWNRVKKKDHPKLCRDFLKAGFAHAENEEFVFLHNLDNWRGKIVSVKTEEIKRLEGTALAFAIIQENMLALCKGTREDVNPLQVKGKPPKKRHLTPSVHNGGIALKLMAGIFGRTLSWASRMRVKVSAAGLCSYKRRTTTYEAGSPEWTQCSLERQLGVKAAYCWKGIDGKYRKEITSACEASFFTFKRAKKGIRKVKLKGGQTMYVEAPLRVLLKPKSR